MDTTVEVDTSDDEMSDAEPIEITPITGPPDHMPNREKWSEISNNYNVKKYFVAFRDSVVFQLQIVLDNVNCVNILEEMFLVDVHVTLSQFMRTILVYSVPNWYSFHFSELF